MADAASRPRCFATLAVLLLSTLTNLAALGAPRADSVDPFTAKICDEWVFGFSVGA